ncbi:NAC transcription factor 32-like isoform X2 [Spinacia oleracea]|uniref:NAC transcription factor 32-like isoform X2 n=1 Tax=Spinacia oleracea TaxID=3562 RepID=A0ABM3RDX0_SPIOL|nr:NAC transcription factor 32-like isoform X2 [Spinacia oleracea]
MELIQNPNQNNPTIEDEREAFYKALPPGFRFTPYDRELILFYLIPKIKGDVVPLNLMHEANIYNCHPQQLAENYAAQGKGKWYFFTPRDKKYMNGGRPNRKAGDGYWKATGADKKIVDESGIIIGHKRSLVYYEGKPKKGQGHKTNWIMYEFVVKDNPSSTLPGMRLDNAVLCSIHYNDVNYNNVHINNDTNVIVTENVVINNTNDYVYNYPQQQQQQQQGGGLMFPNTTQSTPLALPPPPPSSLPPLPASDFQYGSTSNDNGFRDGDVYSVATSSSARKLNAATA